MKIKDVMNGGWPLFSFEFFPPKDDAGAISLFETIANLKELRPAYVSVTYGAGGSTRRKTIDITKRIKHEIGLEAMAHLTCVGHGREEILPLLDELEQAGIENIMALRGDPPQSESSFVPHPDGFRYADGLVSFIRSRKNFCLGVAGYPEVHPEAASKDADLANLKRKVEAGGDFVVTQLFFEPRDYFDFVERAGKVGIKAPIVPGIMPVTNVAQIKRFTQMCGAKLPSPLLAKLEAVDGDPKAVAQVGIEHATRQCQELLRGGAPGIHFYTLNKSHATRTILSSLSPS
ncbi:MAG: methylenetetrahydrofolate reductase [NAD(P)H] [Candidatus Binatia bacterium]|jgi:methylenetetrahydrofolate reductase (NADPH)|nr:methylenetetrahydrofolate reductase [NAD(P)H] [Candidatus Binatia bacterium]